MKKEFLESFGGEMFASFSADEASVIAGNARYTDTAMATFGPDGSLDASVEIDNVWPDEKPDN